MVTITYHVILISVGRGDGRASQVVGPAASTSCMECVNTAKPLTFCSEKIRSFADARSQLFIIIDVYFWCIFRHKHVKFAHNW